MKATVSTMLLFAVAVFTVASDASGKNSTDKDQLISILNQDEPNRLACFPVCFPTDINMGKREYVERAAEINDGEHSANAFNKLRRWLEVKDLPSSPLASSSLVTRKLGLKPERKARESQSFHRRETADSRSDRQQAFRSTFS